jgi:hypothetical protein
MDLERVQIYAAYPSHPQRKEHASGLAGRLCELIRVNLRLAGGHALLEGPRVSTRLMAGGIAAMVVRGDHPSHWFASTDSSPVGGKRAHTRGEN